MPNVTPLPIDLPADRHLAFGMAEGIIAHVPGAQEAINSVFSVLERNGTLSPRLVELVRLRTAFHSQCRFCMSARLRPADEVDEDLVCSLERPYEAPDLTDQERSALRFADLFSNDHLAIDAGVYESMREHFTESELVELGLWCSLRLGLGRLSATWAIVEHLPDTFSVDTG
jgi:alkylhydroperoxidase family enzyme